jgi:hypothetical protein
MISLAGTTNAYVFNFIKQIKQHGRRAKLGGENNTRDKEFRGSK